MDYRKSRRLMQYFVVGGGVLIMAACIMAPTKLILGLCMAVGAVAMAAGFIVGAKHYKCPHCGKSLMGSRGAIPSSCPHCGEKLR